jgi:hypothetical protein
VTLPGAAYKSVHKILRAWAAFLPVAVAVGAFAVARVKTAVGRTGIAVNEVTYCCVQTLRITGGEEDGGAGGSGGITIMTIPPSQSPGSAPSAPVKCPKRLRPGPLREAWWPAVILSLCAVTALLSSPVVRGAEFRHAGHYMMDYVGVSGITWICGGVQGIGRTLAGHWATPGIVDLCIGI